MTRDEAKKLLPVIQAFADGKDVQLKIDDKTWMNRQDPVFHPKCEYRIKPEPLECWLVVLTDGSIFHRSTKEEAERTLRAFHTNAAIHHMREVI